MTKLFVGYKKRIGFVKVSENKILTKDSILKFFKTLVDLDFERDEIKPIVDATKYIANAKEKNVEFDDAVKEFDKYYQDYEAELLLYTDMQILDNVSMRMRIYNNLYNK